MVRFGNVRISRRFTIIAGQSNYVWRARKVGTPPSFVYFRCRKFTARSEGLTQQISDHLWLACRCPRAGVAAPTLTVHAAIGRDETAQP